MARQQLRSLVESRVPMPATVRFQLVCQVLRSHVRYMLRNCASKHMCFKSYSDKTPGAFYRQTAAAFNGTSYSDSRGMSVSGHEARPAEGVSIQCYRTTICSVRSRALALSCCVRRRFSSNKLRPFRAVWFKCASTQWKAAQLQTTKLHKYF